MSVGHVLARRSALWLAWLNAHTVVTVLTVVTTLTTFTALPAQALEPDPAAEARHERGRRLYDGLCYFCHGYAGDARTLAATLLSPPPRDFTATPDLDAARIVTALREGRPGTAMTAFTSRLDADGMAVLADYVVREFVQQRARRSRYHSAENGWPAHDRHAAAYPFADGRIGLDVPVDTLDDSQRAGRSLFLSACISCHDRSRQDDPGPVWQSRPLSYPRPGFAPGQHAIGPDSPAAREVDAISAASAYARHDRAPDIPGLSRRERAGEALFQANCAFCHGADATGRNWIGQFIEPPARDLTTLSASARTPRHLRAVIRAGLPGTSMPAWRSVLSERQVNDLVAYLRRRLACASSSQGASTAGAQSCSGSLSVKVLP
ncbi:c-type cytochrome [Sphaerotilus mobilis]|uniref:Cytochrome c oxidase cbb3-type subunit 3 n=1 Tax=Sphaerotilus mobilis TaxID=47994 RepID=A0A4V2EX40_9BURK|nr:cytochrome c [Sphaerotilus mobilis]RZS58160.1 cytochrome c oxidase cbb3-type subunit 3 [Sphaerotilus mobilis]